MAMTGWNRPKADGHKPTRATVFIETVRKTMGVAVLCSIEAVLLHIRPIWGREGFVA
jgi:hypothetical protein